MRLFRNIGVMYRFKCFGVNVARYVDYLHGIIFCGDKQ